MSIVVEGVTKMYGEQKALDNVSFKVKRGEVLGFLGPNGAGKSTMMKIISCFIPPTSGKVIVNGSDIETDSMKVRSSVGYLPESNPLYYDMYVKEYLLFVCGLYGVNSDATDRVEKMIAKTGLQREQHKKIGQLSKGYKQRVGIAQALIHDPDILILDEPTSGLDPNQLQDIRALIKDLGKEKTVMFSSHIMQEVEAVSDRIIIIDKGKLVTDRAVRDDQGTSLQQIVVEFESEVDQSILAQIDGVHSVIEGDGFTYTIEGDRAEDIRKKVAKWAKNNDNLILSLKNVDENLEEVFRKHTS
jgi:ABC-2 type transport system ATP-binding protein